MRARLGDRTNMVYRDTLVTRGEGKALVVATGRDTEIGRIQSLTGGLESSKTQLQTQLDQLGNQLATAMTPGDWVRVTAGALTPMLVNEATKRSSRS